MNDREITEIVELLYPYFIKKFKNDSEFKKCIKSTNATVVTGGSPNTNVTVKFPYDLKEIEVINKSTSDLLKDDLVCIHYFIDFKNAYVAYKIEE